MENRNIILTTCNRDGAKIWFEPIKDDEYIIRASKDYVTQYARILFKEIPNRSRNFDMKQLDDKRHVHKFRITGYDPSGGPMIEVGSRIGDKTLVRIYRGNFTLRFVIK